MIDTNVFQDKKAVYYTLGCKLNFAETSSIGKTLKEAGIRTVRKGEKADICVINTCSVTEVADKKCRQAIHRLSKEHPGAFIVVTGCYAQLKPEQIADIEGVDLVLGAEQKGELINYLGDLKKREHGEAVTTVTKDIRAFSPSCSRGDRTRYFLKVQDGCEMVVTISAHTVRYLSHAEEAVTERLKTLWLRRVRVRLKEERRLCLPE